MTFPTRLEHESSIQFPTMPEATGQEFCRLGTLVIIVAETNSEVGGARIGRVKDMTPAGRYALELRETSVLYLVDGLAVLANGMQLGFRSYDRAAGESISDLGDSEDAHLAELDLGTVTPVELAYLYRGVRTQDPVRWSFEDLTGLFGQAVLGGHTRDGHPS